MTRFSRMVERLAEYPSLLISRMKGLSFNHVYTCLIAKSLIGDAKTIIDVGSHEGEFSNSAKHVFPNAKIYAFDPQSNFGLWDKNGKAVFYVNHVNTGASSFLKPLDDYKKYIGDVIKTKAERKRFDTLNIKIKRPCFVKIDVEGGEEKVLKGFGERLKEVDVLQIEWFFRDFHENQMRLGTLLPLLEKYGFVGFIQKELGYINGYPSACDLIFFKRKLK